MVKSGMIIGLGSGSTVYHFIVELSRRVTEEGIDLLCVPTSVGTETLARDLSLPLTTLDEEPEIDLDVDGADEVDPQFNLIKGGGGAHVREKIVASASRRIAIVVDESKLSERIGQKCAVPVELIPIALPLVSRRLTSLGGIPKLRRSEGGEEFASDNGNRIVDCDFGPIDDPLGLERSINGIVGVVDCGIFPRMADLVIVGTGSGTKLLSRG